MKKAILTAISASVLIISSSFAVANAQTIGTQSIDGIDITSSPANPAPGTTITVSLQSYSTNLTGANISWSVNGKVTTKGAGIDSINVTAPAAGQIIKVMATINTTDGASIQKLISLTAGDVDLVVEPTGYTPPLFQGKSPFTYQGTVTIVAVPHLVDSSGKAIDPKNLIYQWKQDTFVLGSMSGYGKQSISIKGSVISQPIKIDVVVGDTSDASIHAEKNITLNPVQSSISFYQDDPLYGVLYNKAINGNFQLIHNQTKIIAAPYGFNIPGTGFVYNWSINGGVQNALSSSRSIVLGVNSGQQGSSNIDLNLQNTADDILQNAESSFTAVFSSKSAATTTSIF